MKSRKARYAAGIFAAIVIIIALWRYPEAAGIAITAAFGLITALLGLGGF